MAELKTCGRCRTNPRSRKHAWCQPCRSEHGREFARANPDYKWESALRRVYNITVEDYKAMLVEQGGGCAVCGTVPDERLCVDHDHATGQVRGLLCRNCNRDLSVIERREYAAKLNAYLEKTSGR